MISCWNFEIVVVPILKSVSFVVLCEISFFCCIVIVDICVVVFHGCCDLWFGCCCCTLCFDFKGFCGIFASFLNFCSNENWNRSATFFSILLILSILSFKLLRKFLWCRDILSNREQLWC